MKVVWVSFDGRYSDTPRALHDALRDHPDLEHRWLARADLRCHFPADAETVDIATADAAAALGEADLVVASSHVEVEWEKKPGATYVQAWHGTPLKRVHRDVLWAPDGLLDRLDRDIALWDLLLSPNPDSTRLLRAAFGYDGPVLESGYPRNDVLLPPRHDARRAAVRRELGLAEDRTVVLYAPTWRDAEGYDAHAEVPLLLDVERLGAELGDTTTLLVRGHNKVSDRVQVGDRRWLRDVSHSPPDIADLYTAADVLVTDYSSAMFDFAVTGRPILYFTPDLERYAESIRGFYFDLFREPPGPVLRTTDEVIGALRDLDRVRAAYAERYAAFHARYNPWEDGHATDRVLERLGLRTA